jgi:hypothetical protein
MGKSVSNTGLQCPKDANEPKTGKAVIAGVIGLAYATIVDSKSILK